MSAKTSKDLIELALQPGLDPHTSGLLIGIAAQVSFGEQLAEHQAAHALKLYDIMQRRIAEPPPPPPTRWRRLKAWIARRSA